jgi:Flp pilus assembly protein TadG
MRCGRGQALLELAVCAPVLVLLALGVAAVVQVEEAAAGLDAATTAAAGVASRASDALTAAAVAQTRFVAVVAAYPLRDPMLHIYLKGFGRGTEVDVTSEASVDVAWAGLVLPHRFHVRSSAVVRLELWRTHRVAG